MQNWIDQMASPEVPVNENFEGLKFAEVFAKNPVTSGGLVWGYWGGRWGGLPVADGTLALTAAVDNYIVASRSSGVMSASSSPTDWGNLADYGRVYKVVAGVATVISVEDHRAGYGGIHGQSDAAGADTTQVIAIAASDEVSALTAGVAKATFRLPYGFVLLGVRASLTTAQVSGSIFTVDINANGTSVLSTKITIDNTEKTSKTAVAGAVISTSSLSDDAEITVDIDQVGAASAAAGLKVYLIGKKA